MWLWPWPGVCGLGLRLGFGDRGLGHGLGLDTCGLVNITGCSLTEYFGSRLSITVCSPYRR